MKKIILLGVVVSSLLFSIEVEDYMKIKKVDAEKNVAEFKNLNNMSSGFNPNEFKSFDREKDLNKNIDKLLDESVKKYPGEDYMTKDEYKKVVFKVKRAREMINKGSVSDYILYLTSETVPVRAQLDVSHSIGILQENGIRIQTKQYYIGFPDDFKKIVLSQKAVVDKLSKKEQKYILDNYKLKVDPRMFNEFNITKVPAMIFATCKGKYPNKKNCKFKYIIKGDISVEYFFEKIAENEPKYKKYHEILVGNKINYNIKGDELK